MPTFPSVSIPRGRVRRRTRALATGVGLGALVLLASGCATGAKVADDTLTVTGSPASDTIVLRLKAGDPNVVEVDDAGDGTANFSFDRQTFSKITVLGGGGNDTLRIDRSNGVFTDTELTTLAGGAGTDTLLGDVGAETLDGGAGNDLLDGNQGSDTLLGGADDDTIQWEPGDGSDVVEGQDGTDLLQFNGSAASEAFDISANGGRVRFFRNIGSVTMDLDEVETLNVATFGGADTVTVGHLGGTDVVTVNPDLGAIGGGDDGQIDEVIAAPGTTVGRDGAAATVDGLGAQIRVVNGSSTDRIHITGTTPSSRATVVGTATADAVTATADGTDVTVSGATPGVHVRLTAVPALAVTLGGGDDSFSATGNLAPLTALNVNGEGGDDTLLGGNGADLIIGETGNDVIDGNQGNDTVLAGADDDTITWDPGDASDVVEGQSGTDRLRFNGSAANEAFDVSANGGRVRFLRNIGAITMDLDDVETLDVAALGGTDTVTVGQLAGTDLTTVNPDLGLSGGGDDGQVDEVIVAPGTTVGRTGTAATIDGLGAQVRIVNGSPTDRIHVTGASSGIVTVQGTAGVDAVTASTDGTDVTIVGATPGVHLRLTTVASAVLNLGDSDDSFSAAGNLAALISLRIGGDGGNDTLLGGNGADVILGGAGDDTIDGNQGNDTILAGADNDTITWDPGDASDVVEGQSGTDRLRFNGSAASEIIDVAANGGRIRLVRNIGAIFMDLDDVEVIDIAALAGTDNVTVNDLAGTDVTAVDVALAATGGAPDAIADEVIVNGTTGNDTITVVDVGATVETRGLAATVRVTGTDPTLDRLTVNGLAGADTITPTAGAGALLILNLLP